MCSRFRAYPGKGPSSPASSALVAYEIPVIIAVIDADDVAIGGDAVTAATAGEAVAAPAVGASAGEAVVAAGHDLQQ